MATRVDMPKLSDTMEEGIILKWVKKEGDAVKQGEIIAEVQTDKADMELEAYDSGILRKIFVPEGKGAAVGKPIAVIASENEDISALLAGTGSAQPVQHHVEKPVGAEEKPSVAAEEPSVQHVLPTTVEQKSGENGGSRVKISPLAKKLRRKRTLTSLHSAAADRWDGSLSVMLKRHFRTARRHLSLGKRQMFRRNRFLFQ